MKKNSYWYQNIKKENFSSISDDLYIDILIIGGGITGILLAYYLKDSPFRIVVIEKNEFGSDMTGSSTGKLSVLQGLIYQEISSKYQEQDALLYYQSHLDALLQAKTIIEKEHIECDFQQLDHFIYTNEKQNIAKIEKEKAFFIKNNIPILTNLPKDLKALCGFGLSNQACFHPLKYIYALINICQKHGIEFYEKTCAYSIKQENLMQEIVVNNHKVSAMHTIVASRYPLNIGFHTLTPMLNQSITYLSTSKSKQINYQSNCIDDNALTKRPIHNGLLVGGFGHDVGDKEKMNQDIQKQLQMFHKEDIDVFWSGQDCMSGRILPYIGYYFHQESYCYVATGFNKWGMTSSHLAAKLISDLILHKKNRYLSLYNPLHHRHSLTKQSLKKLIRHSYLGYINYRFVTTKQDHQLIDGKVGWYNGKYFGLAFDEQKCLYKINPICSHLKGMLTFNCVDRTWDCICHGSRFHIDGSVYKGPSQENLEVYSKEGEDMKITYITLDQIDFQEVDYRTSLYESIKRKGITIPIKASIIHNRYYCKDGNKRLSIIKRLKKEGIDKKIAVIATNDGSTRSSECWNSRNTH